MRKLLCGCAVAAAAAVGGTYAAADYTCRHPASWVARAFFVACRLGVAEANVVRAGQATAESGFRGVGGLFAGPAAGCPDGPACLQGHDGGEEPAAAPEEAEDGPPALLPGQIVVRQEEDPPALGAFGELLPLKPLPPVRDLVGATPLPGAAEDSEAEEVAMPRAEDDTLPAMPAADDVDRDCCDAPAKRMAAKDVPEKGEDGFWGALWQGSGAGNPEKKEKADEPAYPHFDGRMPCVPRTIKGTEGHPGVEECDGSHALRSVRPLQGNPESPKHYNVDTMEFRPSDAPFGSDLRGPF
jgi:hypothetical protein